MNINIIKEKIKLHKYYLIIIIIMPYNYYNYEYISTN